MDLALGDVLCGMKKVGGRSGATPRTRLRYSRTRIGGWGDVKDNACYFAIFADYLKPKTSEGRLQPNENRELKPSNREARPSKLRSDMFQKHEVANIPITAASVAHTFLCRVSHAEFAVLALYCTFVKGDSILEYRCCLQIRKIFMNCTSSSFPIDCCIRCC